MAAPGVEMIIGVSRDPVFGPIVMLGLGGIYVEVLGDVVFGPAPLDAEDVRDMLSRLRGRRRLEGVRGQPAADVEAFVDVVVRLSRFAADHADAIAEIDLNPVIVHAAGQGVSIVDALIVPTLEKHLDR